MDLDSQVNFERLVHQHHANKNEGRMICTSFLQVTFVTAQFRFEVGVDARASARLHVNQFHVQTADGTRVRVMTLTRARSWGAVSEMGQTLRSALRTPPDANKQIGARASTFRGRPSMSLKRGGPWMWMPDRQFAPSLPRS